MRRGYMKSSDPRNGIRRGYEVEDDTSDVWIKLDGVIKICMVLCKTVSCEFDVPEKWLPPLVNLT